VAARPLPLRQVRRQDCEDDGANTQRDEDGPGSDYNIDDYLDDPSKHSLIKVSADACGDEDEDGDSESERGCTRTSTTKMTIQFVLMT
jgi:hypothetical protein